MYVAALRSRGLAFGFLSLHLGKISELFYPRSLRRFGLPDLHCKKK